MGRILSVYAASDGTYGSPRVCRSLRDAGIAVSRKRVVRLMRVAGLRARAAKPYRINPAVNTLFFVTPNRVVGLEVSRIDRVWTGDITYIKVARAWRYLAVVMDRCSRRILAWALGAHKNAALTLRAVDRALKKRRPSPGLIFHSDRGAEFAAYELRTRLAAHGALQSMNRPGTPTDNAHMESFFHSLKTELIDGRTFDSDAALRAALARYIRFYNSQRLHTALDYCSPIDYERAAA
jgi:putative transposase